MTLRRGRPPKKLILITLMLALTSAWAAPPPDVRPEDRRDSRADQARRLIEKTRSAYEARQWTAARKYAEDAYRLHPASHVLGLLAAIYDGMGRQVEAGDLARRYLASPPPGENPDELRDARKILASVREPTGQIDLSGTAGSLVILDQHLVGVLPLAAGLLLRPGSHMIRIELDDRESHRETRVAAGDRFELSLRLPDVILVVPKDSLAEGEGDVAIRHLIKLINLADVKLMYPEQPEVGHGKGTQQAPLSLLLSRRVSSSGCVVTAELQPGPRREQTAEGCAPQQWEPLLVALAQDVLRQRDQPQVSLRVPALTRHTRHAVELEIDGSPYGALPYEGQVPAGDHTIKLIEHGQVLYQARRFIDGSENSLSFAERRQARPRWRVATGVAIGLAGAALIGFGIPVLLHNNQCVPDSSGACTMIPIGNGYYRPEVYDSFGIGAGLIAGGAVTLTAGLVLSLWPAGGRVISAAPVERITISSASPERHP